jgi:hypothetical protein
MRFPNRNRIPLISHRGTMRQRIRWSIICIMGIGMACNLSQSVTTPPVLVPATPSEESIPVTPTATISLPAGTPTPFPSYERFVCHKNPTTVALLVNPVLATAARAGLDQFENDLCAAGYDVVERSLDFAAPPEVRAYLADLYGRTDQKLEGAIFIGSVPLAYQFFLENVSDPNTPPLKEEAISFQYYSDLDGEFTASPDYHSPGGHAYSFDRHIGKVDWEIWTAVLPLYRGDEAQTAEALKRYFEKNHLYRTHPYAIPNIFLIISEHFIAKTASEQTNFLNLLRTGPYAWTPLSNQSTSRIYFTGPTLKVADGYSDLSAGVADITVTETHGDWTMSGQINIAWAESNPMKTVLFWSDGCSIGNLEHAENFLTSVVYSTTSSVLVAKGSTNDSGGLGTNREGYYGHNVAVRLAAGKNLGQSILGHMNVALIPPWEVNREFHFSMLILIGDPTLRLRP